MLYLLFSFHITEKKIVSNEEIALMSYVIFFVLTILVVFVLFFLMFQKRKNQLLLDKVVQQQQFDAELIKTQQEIQEETLKHVGRELHDNVGQMLVLATMQMNALANGVKQEDKSKVDNSAKALKDALEEVRALSKSLNSDVIFKLGFEATVKNEIDRLNKSGLIRSELLVVGEKVSFENKKDEVILFRMLQEFFSNTLKYAEAEHLNVSLEYGTEYLTIMLEDDGQGFDMATITKGSGLINLEKRAELIQAQLELKTKQGEGTTLLLQYPYKTSWL